MIVPYLLHFCFCWEYFIDKRICSNFCGQGEREREREREREGKEEDEVRHGVKKKRDKVPVEVEIQEMLLSIVKTLFFSFIQNIS
jgi:hypothetical protein